MIVLIWNFEEGFFLLVFKRKVGEDNFLLKIQKKFCVRRQGFFAE